ncbi:MAG: hypothetical protein O2985_14455, partial [Proteobacteria bacterium]|nr:hypothetical protein [Pseudomonadota bacterium]
HAAVARKIHLSQLFSFPEPPLILLMCKPHRFISISCLAAATNVSLFTFKLCAKIENIIHIPALVDEQARTVDMTINPVCVVVSHSVELKPV